MKITESKEFAQRAAAVRRCTEQMAELRKKKKHFRSLLPDDAITAAAKSYLQGGELRTVYNHGYATIDIRLMVISRAMKLAREDLKHFKRNWQDPDCR